MKYNITRNNRRSMISKTSHCTGFDIPKQLPLRNFIPPPSLRKVLNNHQRYVQFLNNFLHIKRIAPEHYLVLFKILLYIEYRELELDIAKHNLKNQLLQQVGGAFVITVPTLDEDDPFINIGDTVKLQIVNSKVKCFSQVVDINGKEIFVCLLKPNEAEQIRNHEVNVTFRVTNWSLKCFHYVLHIMCKHSLLDLMYPKVNSNCALPQGDLNWIQKSVAENSEQKQAVINILYKSAYPAPYILFGPPGTGKTTTLVEVICQIRNQHKSKNILICTPSNAAADEITKRLLTLLPHKDIFRMYAASKHSEDVNKKINPISNFVDDTTVFLAKEIFILKKIVITTLVTSIRLVALNLHSTHFSYIFIDEAGQSTELESLIPYTLTSFVNKAGEGRVHAQIILAGDPYQLGPIVKCRQIEHILGKSLLERLMMCEPYQKVGNKYNPRYITKLVRNFRNQASILRVPNKLFYNNELLCCRSDTNTLNLNWSIMLNKTFPILFIEVNGKEKKTLTKSVYNEEEIKVVSFYTKKLISSKAKDIGIITPFRQQKLMINKCLNEYGLKNVAVGTVETFQGQEKEIIILSTARSEYFVHDGKKHIGLLSNAKRFNVAVTRAKNLLIVVGNPQVLCIDNCWNALWKYCKKNNACNSIDVTLM